MRQLHSSWTFIVLLFFCWVGTTARAQEEDARPASTAEQTDWMGALPDAFPMCKLSIPGTHDSGARFGGPDFHTQNLDIPAQLRQGIRAFDIRLQEKDGKLGVFHSIAFQQVYWETDVLPAFLRFLQEHPTETLVVSLKREGGIPEAYATLLAECYPGLRRTDYRIDYTVRSFQVDEAKAVFRTRPQNLSLDEMFAVAQTYEPGSNDFKQVFDVAVRMYPDSEVANLNAACALLEQGLTEQAQPYLDKAGDSPQAANARGVALRLQGRYDEAVKCLHRAADAGLKEAESNLAGIE